MRYFFHLYDGADVILDQIGVEVSKLDQVRDVLVQTVREMQCEQSLEISELETWELRVVVGGGTVVMTVRLSDLNSSELLNGDWIEHPPQMLLRASIRMCAFTLFSYRPTELASSVVAMIRHRRTVPDRGRSTQVSLGDREPG